MNTQTSYNFTPEEAKFFGDHSKAIQESVNQFNHGLKLVMSQQKLEGDWRIRADGSGLEPVTPLAA